MNRAPAYRMLSGIGGGVFDTHAAMKYPAQRVPCGADMDYSLRASLAVFFF